MLAVVGGELIMLSDVRAARDLGFVDAPPSGDPVRSALARLIDRTLIVAEVDRYAPPEPSREELDRALASVRSRFADRNAYEGALERSGLTEARLRERLRDDLRIDAYLDQRFAADTPEKRRAMIDDWIGGLRRRAEIVNLYVPPK